MQRTLIELQFDGEVAVTPLNGSQESFNIKVISSIFMSPQYCIRRVSEQAMMFIYYIKAGSFI